MRERQRVSVRVLLMAFHCTMYNSTCSLLMQEQQGVWLRKHQPGRTRDGSGDKCVHVIVK